MFLVGVPRVVLDLGHPCPVHLREKRIDPGERK